MRIEILDARFLYAIRLIGFNPYVDLAELIVAKAGLATAGATAA